MFTPGRESSEHARALRAEVLGVVLVALGIVLLFLGETLGGLGLVAIGALLVAHVAAAYARSRGEVKASAVRPRVIRGG
jgi:hypothetical protein